MVYVFEKLKKASVGLTNNYKNYFRFCKSIVSKLDFKNY